MPPLLHRQAEAGGHRRPSRALRAPLRPEGQEVLSRDARAEAERLGPLRAAKLRALVRRQWRSELTSDAVTGSFPGGATLAQGGTSRAWVLIDDANPASLGPALVWASRRQVSVLDVVVDDGSTPSAPGAGPASGIVARRAAECSDPPAIWRVDGPTLARAAPATAPAVPDPPPEALAFADLLRAHGADPVVEHGVLLGEVLGLEVARVTAGTTGWQLEVGVGRLDRQARAEMRPDEPDGAAIEAVVAVVREWRRAGVANHPANILARERWLRAAVVAHPALAGAARLTAIPPPLPRGGLRQGGAAPAAGIGADGQPVIVVCSTGVDVDLVPAAADARRVHTPPGQPDPRLVVVMPEGDDYPVTRLLAAALRHPAEVRTVGRDWARLTDPA